MFLYVTLPIVSVVGMHSVCAQSTCAQYLEHVVHPVKASVLWKQLASVPNIKGEFETSEKFAERVERAMSVIGDTVIVEVPIQREFISYNADSSRLSIQTYAFSNHDTKYSGVFGYGTPFYGRIEYGVDYNIDVVFPSEERHLGSYIGTNAMGVEIQVTKVKRNTKVIFEREANWGEGLFPDLPQHDAPVISLNNITPDEAKRLKSTARAAIIYIPKAPYYAKGKYPWGDPTIEGPMDIDETIEVSIGDIQCGLLLNLNGKVIGTATTR